MTHNNEQDSNKQLISLQSKELDMLKEFIKICEKYKLRYYLVGGTLLGAVRHKGFIPWDDDIDVGMPRAEYERFLSVCQAELGDRYFLQNHITEPAYPMNFSKIRDNNTTFVESSLQNRHINHGVYIDIFPLDGYKKSLLFQYNNRITQWRISAEYIPSEERGKSRLRNFVKAMLRIMYRDIDKVVKCREKLIKSYAFEQSELVYNAGGAWGTREIVPREWFGEGTIGVFEGIEVKLPSDWDRYLTNVYGDYMTPPQRQANRTS